MPVILWYIGGSRCDGAQIGRFSSWDAKVFLPKKSKMPTSHRVYLTQPHPKSVEAILQLE